MTFEGGAYKGGYGTIFKINTDGTGYQVLYNFAGYPDGAGPVDSLTLSGATLFGMTMEGGAKTPEGAGLGTIFKINTDGTGYHVLHNFARDPDGALPRGSLTLSGTTLYGMTGGGGPYDQPYGGYGTIFKINTDGTGYQVLYNFAGYPTDGTGPLGSLTLSGTTLYGMTSEGGANGPPYGYGTIFQMNTDSTGYQVLYSFAEYPTDGAGPSGTLTLSGTTLYGMTQWGGTNNWGTIFNLNLATSGSLTVTISPSAAVSAGAMWNVDGGTWQASGTTVSNLSVGSHQVAFKPVTGWNTPSAQTATIKNGQTTSLSGTYTQSGSLKVTISPTAAVSAGAMWNVDNGTWQASGATVSNLSVSMHTVAFKTIPGWTPPHNQTFNITNGQTTSLTGTYVQQTSISVTYPSGGSFIAGAKCTIAWTYAGNPGSSVSIALLQAGSPVSTIASSTSVGSNGNGSYTWTIPGTQASGTNYEVQVSSTTISSCKATSNNFTIVGPSISVTSPKGGETWSAGEKHNITWSYQGNPGSSVKIVLVEGSATAATIVSSTSIGNNGTGSYAWIVPATLVTGSNYKVQVTSMTNSSLTSMSQGAFTIKGGISITVTSPGGGETWSAGSTHNITWSYQGSPGSTVNIQLLNQGTAVSSIKTAASIGKSGSGSYAWTIPKGTSGSSYQVQVTSTANSFCTSTSNYFTIK
jgi:uncharacterized repeat protein (TIGR03803 family)